MTTSTYSLWFTWKGMDPVAGPRFGIEADARVMYNRYVDDVKSGGMMHVELRFDDGAVSWTIDQYGALPGDRTEDEEILIKALRARFDYSRLARLAINIEHMTGQARATWKGVEDQINDLDTLTRLLEAAADQ